jgi:hypothetical protein
VSKKLKPSDPEWKARVSELEKLVTVPKPREAGWAERADTKHAGPDGRSFKGKLTNMAVKVLLKSKKGDHRLEVDDDERTLLARILVMVCC